MLKRIETGDITLGDILAHALARRKEETNTANVGPQGSNREVHGPLASAASEVTYNDALSLSEHYAEIGKLYSGKAWALISAMRNVRFAETSDQAATALTSLQETINTVGLITEQEKSENEVLEAGTKISELLLSAILQIPDLTTMANVAGLAIPEVRAFKHGAQAILNLRQTVEPSKPVWPPVKLSGDNAQYYPKV